ncbi:MAG: alpha/beta hydrolase family protein [Panacagrimonas sp.]
MSSNTAALPWWQALPDDYYRRPFDTELDRTDPLKVLASAALDQLSRSALGTVMALALTPTLGTARARARERERLRFYAPLAGTDADQVFVAPPPTPVRTRTASTWGLGFEDAVCERLSFNSPFETLNPELRADYASQRRNRRATALYIRRPLGKPRPTLIFVHGFLLDDARLNSRAFCLPWLFRNGYDVLLPSLPFHGPRAERLHPFSGYGFFRGGLARTNESMLQGVSDLRVWVQALLDRGAPQVGISGLSLGGYMTAMLSNVEPRLAFAIPNSPVVAAADMAMEWQPLGALMRRSVLTEGWRFSELRQSMALHSPLSHRPRLDAGRLLVIGGAGDRFTSPRFVSLLHQHWAGSQLHWFPGNHLLHLQQGRYLRLMKKFMDRNVGLDSPAHPSSVHL